MAGHWDWLMGWYLGSKATASHWPESAAEAADEVLGLGWLETSSIMKDVAAGVESAMPESGLDQVEEWVVVEVKNFEPEGLG